MKTFYYKFNLTFIFVLICVFSFSQKIKYEIAIKGVIENIEDIKHYTNVETCLQLVEYKQLPSVSVTVSKIGTMMFTSDFPCIKIPEDGIVNYKVNNLKYNTDYFIAIQMLNSEYSEWSKVLLIRQADTNVPSGRFHFSKSNGKLKEPTDLDLGKFYMNIE